MKNYTINNPTKVFWPIIIALGVTVSFIFIYTVRGEPSFLRNAFKKIPLLSNIIKDTDQTRAYGKLQEINFFLPNFSELALAIQNPDEKTPLSPSYKTYYEKIIALMPQNSDAYHILGVLYYKENNLSKAKFHLENAIKLNPRNFWYFYDYAILTFKDNPNDAKKILSVALRISPQDTIKSISSSKIYMQIISAAGMNYNLAGSLKEGYQKAAAAINNPVHLTNAQLKIF